MTHDSTYDVPITIKQGATELNIGPGGTLSFDSGSQETFGGVPTAKGVTITAAKGGSANICLVSFQVVDGTGAAIAGVFDLDIYLSDSAAGAGLTATTASGNVQSAGTNGADFGTLTSKKALRSQTDATGLYVLSITDSAKTGFYPCCALGAKTIAGAQLVTGNYD